MSECWNEGSLRAYLDRELPAEEMAAAALHLAACAECHGAYNRMAARSSRVGAWMAALDAPSMAAPAPAAKRLHWNRALPVAALALAAGVAGLFVFSPARQTPVVQHPVAAPHNAPPSNRVQLAAVPVEMPGPATAAAPTRPRVHRVVARASKPDYFLALDDQPIETGYIVRMDLEGRQADVIVDDTGKPRAIRPVPTK